MSKYLTVNCLIKYRIDNKEVIKRVLYIDDTNDISYLYDIYAKTGFPQFQRISSIAKDISQRRAELCEFDPFAIIVDEKTLSEKEKTIRDDAWKVIEHIAIGDNESDIFVKSKRGSLIALASEKFGLQRITVYKYLRKYWQRGKIKNALLPDYKNSGGKGIDRKPKDKKRGRKRKGINIVNIGEGINIDENVKKIFRLAITEFYRDSKEITLKDVFNLMLARYFAEDYEVRDGIRRPILIDATERPTYGQFKYWHNKTRDNKKDIISRKGKSYYELNNRPILGSATSEVFGPGSRFEIDATVADVYLISNYNPSWIIGRPVIYIVIDVFSRLIVGLYIGLEGPSWVGAMMALANTVTNKQAFCLEYGISIDENEWSSHYLPSIILADGGELAGNPVEELATNLQITVETASVGRGDLKGIVERNFRRLHESVKPIIPGQVIKDAQKRRGNDYRLDAKLNIRQFTKIIISSILVHNKTYRESYGRDKEMIKDNVIPIPINLWDWGIRNRSGHLRTFSEDIVKLNLLPKETAKITRGGILFRDMEYSCESAIKEGWFEKDSVYYLDRLPIVYDFRNPNYIYLKSDDGRKFEKCYLLPTEEKYKNMNLHDINYLQDYEKLEGQVNLPDTQQYTADFFAVAQSVVKEAEENHKKWNDPTASKASRLSNIAENKKIEKEKLRQIEAIELDVNEKSSEPSKVIQFPSPELSPGESLGNNFELPNKLELLRRIRKKKKEKKN